MDPKQTAEAAVKRLEDAWNAADGAAFGAPFAADADFVDIRGVWHQGEAIAAGHQQIFDTVYAGSTIGYKVLQARPLGGDAILAHVRGRLSAPAGPLAGEHEALASLVIVGSDDGYRIAAFHNTLVAQPGR